MDRWSSYRNTDNGASEREIYFNPTGGHTHDGNNSSTVQLQPGQVNLRHLDKDTVKYLKQQPQVLKHMPFTLPGNLFPTTSPPYSPMRFTYLVAVQANFGTPGTTNTIFNILQNGNNVQTFIVDVQGAFSLPWVTLSLDHTQMYSPCVIPTPGGITWPYNHYPEAIAIGVQDTIKVQITTAGTGAADFIAHLIFNDNSQILI